MILSFDEIRSRVCEAIAFFYSRDTYLVHKNAHERSMTFRLGIKENTRETFKSLRWCHIKTGQAQWFDHEGKEIHPSVVNTADQKESESHRV